MSNYYELFKAKTEGVTDSEVSLELWKGFNCLIVDGLKANGPLTHKDINRFCEITPSGKELLLAYWDFRNTRGSNESCSFVHFARHVLGRSQRVVL